MNRGITIGLTIVVLIAVGAVVAWMLTQPPDSVAAPKPVDPPKPAAAAPVPEPPALPAPKPAPEPAPVAETAPAPAEPAPLPPQPEILNDETLQGTSWKSGPMEITLLPDHRIQFGQRIPEGAKWSVEEGRVKLADDKGEVHYFEIEGTELYFRGSDGKELITRMK